MSDKAALLAQAALDLVGCPFRLHGRDPGTGLDCVGLVLCALRAAGIDAPGPADYGLRNLAIDRHLECVTRVGLAQVRGGEAHAGDVLLFRPAPAQFHLGIVCSGKGVVHAHAGLRRVVVTPGLSLAPVERHWRLARD